MFMLLLVVLPVLVGLLIIGIGLFKKNNKKYFRFFTLFCGLWACIFFNSLINYNNGFYIIWFWSCFIETCLCLMLWLKRPFIYNFLILALFASFPTYLVINDHYVEQGFEKLCATNYEYKIYKKLELPRKYFHEATDKEIAKSKGKLKAGDLVPNVEAIDIDVLRKNIKENHAFRQDAVYEVDLLSKDCIDSYKTLDIDFDKYGVFMCSGADFTRLASYKKLYFYNMDMSKKEKIAGVTSFEYMGSSLSRFIFGKRRTKDCPINSPIAVGVRDFIKFNGEE